MSIDWGEIDKKSNSQSFKSYAPNGEYKVKLDHVEVRDKDTWKSPAVEFHWVESPDYKFPKSIAHWLSMANPAWRAVHNRNILMQFGVEKAKAEELIDNAEKDLDRAKLVQAYQALYKRMAERGCEAEITVHDQYDQNGNLMKSANGTVFGQSDFKSPSVRMAQQPQPSSNDPIAQDEIPF